MKKRSLLLASVSLLCLCMGLLGYSSTSAPSTITEELGDGVSCADNSITITNNTEWVWTNVWLLLNGSFVHPYDTKVDQQQTITIPANQFISTNGMAFDPSTARAWTIEVVCDLGNGKRGEFYGSWH
jgi:hypothetical protein